ncbi:efflux transporter outer membrane subunit [Prosthecobacter sp.]|uniref:efflux transporter outer membrane subunit n=1 Tax=Prosthecobacter sp. TaxID=1965333 RepID=UPI00378482D3
MASFAQRSCFLPVLFGLSACTVGPDYHKPDTSDITPATWRWQTSAPKDDAPKGDWWKVFHDSELNRLEALALADNQNVRAAYARIMQSRANARAAATDWFPNITANSRDKRERTSAHLPTPVPVRIPSAQINTFSETLDLSYELDLWGKVRRSFESARAQAESSAADYNNLLLTLTGDVAATYFQLRALDADLASLRRTIDLREKSLSIIDQRFKAGTIQETDLLRSKTEVATAKAELADIKRQRQEASDNLSLLCGVPATNFRIAERPLHGAPPSIPAGVPATVLERRPDVASAERLVAARNADIGVATAAYFPAISLTAQGGYLSKNTSDLFTADSRVWSIGPSVSLPITGFALIHSNVKRRRAAREEAIATYRQAVLSALKDVETTLAQTRYRAEQAAAQNEALSAASQAADLTRARYDSGAVGYLEFLDAERTRLQTERQTNQVTAQRFIATVRLVKAMGGGW